MTKDRYKTSGFLLFLILGFAFATFSRADDTPRMVSFVAAVSDYPGNAAMYESIENAEKLAAELEKFGFQVTSLFDFTKKEFNESFSKWCEDTSGAELAVVYFCGHGGNYEQESYLIPLGVDIESGADMQTQAIGFQFDVLSSIVKNRKNPQQLSLFLIDGFPKFPFGFNTLATDGDTYDPTGFKAPTYPADGTVLIIPTRFPGEVVSKEDSGRLVSAFATTILKNGTKLNEGIAALNQQFKTETGERRQGIWWGKNYDAEYVFTDNEVYEPAGEPIPAPPDPADVPTGYEALKEDAHTAWRTNQLELAISLFLKIFDEHKEHKYYAEDQLKTLLASGGILSNVFVGKQLVESEKFDFKRLYGPKPNGLELEEARKIIWETGKVFNPVEAADQAQIAAEDGDARAMHVLGLLYLKFNVDEKAIHWFTKASETAADPSESLLFLGQMHLIGRGCKKSIEKAEEYLMEAIKMEDGQMRGNAEAAVFLGHLEVEKQYAKDPGERSFAKAVEWYELARNHRKARANANLGQLYASGYDDVAPDLVKGIETIMDGADTGHDSRCMWILADWFNRGVFRNAEIANYLDSTAAKRYALMAADFGYPDAIEYCNANELKFENAGKPLFKTNEAYLNWKYLEKQAASAEKINH
ncbi:MAG: caspase family protein [Verrucomicrobiales bacterium]|nr:caspase family protein [Verrucomicrobiales bacterium]